MKKGFTLIELLAVIVILAIIALIVTPVVSNIVSNAKIAANARSVEGHIGNIELAIISNAFEAAKTGEIDTYDGIEMTAVTSIENLVSSVTNDNVSCTKFTISHGTVQGAWGCTAEGWSKTYTYTIANGAVADESNGGNEVAANTWDTYYYLNLIVDGENAEYSSEQQTTTTYSDTWSFWGQENTTTGAKQVCGRLPQGVVCLDDQEWTTEAILEAKSRIELEDENYENYVECSYDSGDEEYGYSPSLRCNTNIAVLDDLYINIDPNYGYVDFEDARYSDGVHICEILRTYENDEYVSSEIICN